MEDIDLPKSCSQCKISPAQDQPPLRRCGSCKCTFYCSKECQTIAWKTHKPLCKLTIANCNEAEAFDNSIYGILSPLPSRRLRIELLERFTDLHAWSIQKALYAALLMQGGIMEFKYNERFLEFQFQFRHDYNDNPSIAFTLKNAQFRLLSELDATPRSKAAWEAGLPMVKEKEAKLIQEDEARLSQEDEARLSQEDEAKLGQEDKARLSQENQEQFAGFLSVAYVMEDYIHWSSQPMHHSGARFDSCVRMLPMNWLEHLSRMIQRGMVFRQIEGSRFPATWHPGRMQWVGAKWRWVALSDEELTGLGFKPNFPGFVF